MIRLLWRDLSLYTIIHCLAGILTILSVRISWVLPIILFVGFMIYELNEDYHIKDQAFQDILEYCIGLYGCIIVETISWYVINV